MESGKGEQGKMIKGRGSKDDIREGTGGREKEVLREETKQKRAVLRMYQEGQMDYY